MARCFITVLCSAMAVLVCCTATVWGQVRGQAGGLGAAGAGIGGGGFGAPGGLGGGGFGAGGLGGGGLGGGGLGGGGFGGGGLGTGIGQGGFGQGLGQGGLGQMLGGAGGQIGFGQQSNAGFIGRDSADVTAMFESMTRQNEQFMNRFERTMNRDRNLENAEQAPPPVRVKLKVAFDHPAPTTSPAARAFEQRLNTILAEQNLTGIDVERAGSAVVIRGTAASDWERMLVERLVRLQPGVTSVENQVSLSETTDLPLPPPVDR